MFTQKFEDKLGSQFSIFYLKVGSSSFCCILTVWTGCELQSHSVSDPHLYSEVSQQCWD